METRRPTKAELAASFGAKIPDVLARGLDVVFCGINPGLYSAAIGHHFGRPGNRFWSALHAGGFTDRVFSPYEDRLLLDLGFGVTNLVGRATATAAELTKAELIAGGRELEKKMRRYRPRWVAILGFDAYRAAFQQRRVALGSQDRKLGTASLWVLPNP